MSDVEGKILKMYDESKPEDEDLFESSNVNHLAWTLVVVLAGLVFWLSLALINAENQRYALASGKCQDPVFKGTIDHQCLLTVRSRDHWWQHLWYGFRHVKPEDNSPSRYKRRVPPAPAASAIPAATTGAAPAAPAAPAPASPAKAANPA